MKFLALREAIEKAQNEKKNDTETIIRPVEASGELAKSRLGNRGDGLGSKGVSLNREPSQDTGNMLPPWFSTQRGRVVGGTVTFKPIDKAAAMLISKAPWWAHPPAEVRSEQGKTQNKGKMQSPSNVHAHTSQTCDQIVKVPRSKEVINSDIVAGTVRATDAAITKSQELVDRGNDARAAMEVLANNWRGEWKEFCEESDSRIQELRMSRMTIETEMKLILSQLRDVRKFFLEETYETEVARLREFIDLCERLQRLKASGFLDSVSDILLKL